MNKTLILYAVFFALIIGYSNYAVHIQINEWLTYGALLYPLTFLMSDILSEKRTKEETLKVVRLGVILAIIPTILVSDSRTAFASIFTFFFVQQLDVHIFHAFKNKFEKLWWLRNNGSTIISQFFDTALFFFIAFAGKMPFENIIQLIIGDYVIKIVMALLDTPFFYLFAIKIKNFNFSKLYQRN